MYKHTSLQSTSWAVHMCRANSPSSNLPQRTINEANLDRLFPEDQVTRKQGDVNVNVHTWPHCSVTAFTQCTYDIVGLQEWTHRHGAYHQHTTYHACTVCIVCCGYTHLQFFLCPLSLSLPWTPSFVPKVGRPSVRESRIIVY